MCISLLQRRSCVADCCFSQAAQTLGTSANGARRRYTETLWRLVSKVHKKAVPLLERHAASLQTKGEPSDAGQSEAEKQQQEVQALSILEFISVSPPTFSEQQTAQLTPAPCRFAKNKAKRGAPFSLCMLTFVLPVYCTDGRDLAVSFRWRLPLSQAADRAATAPTTPHRGAGGGG